jgi:hypothetical protein
MDNTNNAKKKVDLSRFGLASSEVEDAVPEVETIGFGTAGYQPAYHNELFAGEEVRTSFTGLVKKFPFAS